MINYSYQNAWNNINQSLLDLINEIKLAKSELIHFIGIGGIGMSGLALIMKDLGLNSRSDILSNKNIERIKQKN